MKHTLLIVEDDKYLIFAYTSAFPSETFELTLARDGEEAMILLKTRTFDLILLDLVMPKKTGIEFLKELRETEQHKRIPVIVATNMNSGKEKEICLEYGISDYCLKTDTPMETIIEKVRLALEE